MFTHKDIETKTIFVLNCIESERRLRVCNGELMLEELNGDEHKTLTKFPFQKILALFIIGPISITTPLIDKCKRYGIALIVVKTNLRPTFVWANTAEANYLLRKRQFEYQTENIDIAKHLVRNKIKNQRCNLIKTRKRDGLTCNAISYCEAAIDSIDDIVSYEQLLGLEGAVSKNYFAAYFQSLDWQGRHPRIKCDILNLTLDIGYTILFNYMECFLRMFGFDLYVGVYHRLWFKRKSLVCDLIEPFRCIIDHTILLAYHRGQFKESDFVKTKHIYQLRQNRCSDYYRVFYNVLIGHKTDLFRYVQQYYRCFMGCKSVTTYPNFIFK